MLEFEQIVTTAYWVILILLVILLASRFYYFKKSSHKRISLVADNSIFKYFRIATIIMIPIFIFGFITFVFVLQRGNLFATTWQKDTLLLLLAVLLTTEIVYNLTSVPERTNRIINIVFLFVISTVGIYLTNLYIQAKKHPSLHNSISIALPFEGKWIATGAGASGLTNHHDRTASQKYAVDIVRIGNDDKLFTGEGIDKKDSHTYGAEVLSPVDGKVVWVIDTLADEPIRERDKLAGNHIVIQFQDSLFVALAHLQPKSIPHKIGDRVAQGDLVGKVGMSGNTDFCHLHIHIQDRAEYNLEHGKTYPLRFKTFKRKRFVFWRTVENEYLLSNDIIKSI